ncbi:class I SAM-dependent methyltransferase [Candidatus Pelagibacter ubique]|nr:class I SAM-dependent methyltransferase [Candidatus Pelagibacter ubique]
MKKIKTLSRIIINSLKNFIFCSKIDFFYSVKVLNKLIYSEYLLSKNFDLNKVILKTNYFEKKYKLEEANWFTHNFQIWDYLLKNKTFHEYLEIGSYEGRSVVYISEKFRDIHLNIVDPFENHDQHQKIDWKKIYNNFTYNISRLENKVTVNKINSDKFFNNNTKIFDLIYIDGSHFANDTMRDFENSFKNLSINGILICDDFLFNDFEDVNLNPIAGLIPMLKKYANKIEILYINHQLFLKKIAE